MNKFTTLLAATTLVSALGFTVPAFAAATVQTIVLTQVDPVILATGWRATDIIGATIYNDEGVEIGKVDDMIITAEGTVPYAVVSVGGFLGMDAHHVVVAAAAMELVNKKLTLHGATKESLTALPDFKFAS